MADFPVRFRHHAVQQMILRGISEVEVRAVLEVGEVIETYPDELPYASRLVLGWSDERPIHVVAMEDLGESLTVIITVYEPDPKRWTNRFRTRRNA